MICVYRQLPVIILNMDKLMDKNMLQYFTNACVQCISPIFGFCFFWGVFFYIKWISVPILRNFNIPKSSFFFLIELHEHSPLSSYLTFS